MRHFTKFLSTVVVALLAFSCTTDTTEDLGVAVGGQTTLTISLEESRTQLGEKADGLYPLYWSEGDQLSLNGVASAALTAEQAGAASTQFTFDGVIGYPYNIIYPASATNEVTFLAEQSYVAGTFAAGAAPMYGYAENENSAIQMNNLVGVLCIQPYGEGITLTSVSVKSESGAIAGTYTVDCATGALTAVADTTSDTVTMSLGDEGLALGATPTPIYITVPAGQYGLFSVTLSTATDKMALYFDSSSKPISAGTVREFTPFVYAANVAEGEEFLIDSADALIRFANIANNFAPYKVAKVVADIDMSGKSWTSIEGFEHVFDGGNFEIKGLNAPLFGETMATEIKNVKLVDVNITTERPEAGALACSVLNEATDISNCSVTGKFTVVGKDVAVLHTELQYGAMIGYSSSKQCYKNLYTNVAIEVKESFVQTVQIGNAVGNCLGKLENVTCHGTINFAGTVGGSSKRLRTGGIACRVYGMKNCVNGSPEDATQALGSITLGGVRKQDTEVGGLAVYIIGATENCHNYAKLTVGGEAANTYVGGLCRYAYSSTISNCSNHGDIVISSKSAQWCLGGLVSEDGSSSGGTFVNCANYGTIDMAKEAVSTYVYAGGLIGRKAKDYATTFDNCTNEGDIKFACTLTCGMRIGGLIGYTDQAKLVLKNNNTNKGNFFAEGQCKYLNYGGIFGQVSKAYSTDSYGTMTNTGDITCTTKTSFNTEFIRASTIFGYINNTTDLRDADMFYVNTGDISVITGQPDNAMVGSICTYRVGHFSNARSFCNVTTDATYVGLMATNTDGYLSKYAHEHCYVGGTLTRNGVKTEITRDNYTTLLYYTGITEGSDAEKEAVTKYYNGYISSIDATPQYKEIGVLEIATADDLTAFAAKVAADATCADHVKVTANIDMTGKSWTPIAGFAGIFDGGNFEIQNLAAPLFGETKLMSLQNVKLTGVNLSASPSGSAEFRYGAIANYVNNANATIGNCSASGEIAVHMTSSQTGHTRIAGLIGRASTTYPISGLENSVNVTVTGNGSFTGKDVFLAGVVSETAGGLTKCKNFGTISAATSLSSAYVSGIVSRSLGNVIACENGVASNKEIGKIICNCDASYTICVGGIYGAFGGNAPTIVSDCVNYANLEVGGTHANNKKYAMIGGITSAHEAFKYEFSRCKNYGDITVSTVSGTVDATNNFFIGGISTGGTTNVLTLKDLENHGNIHVTKDAVFPKNLLVGGVVNVAISSSYTYGKLVNTGNITIEGTVKGELHCGGVAGRIGASTFVGPLINTGTINVDNMVEFTADKSFVGGISGVLNAGCKIVDAVSYCDIIANKVSNVGWITGSARVEGSVLVNNCQLGGDKVTIEIDEEDEAVIEKRAPLTAENYFNHIYGGTTDWTGVANYDGCTFLTAAPSIQ